jgi:hypothetical protein
MTGVHRSGFRCRPGAHQFGSGRQIREWLAAVLLAPDIGGFWLIRAGCGWSPSISAFPPGWARRCGSAAEALLMAIDGRRGVGSELAGPGQTKLAGRVGG